MSLKLNITLKLPHIVSRSEIVLMTSNVLFNFSTSKSGKNGVGVDILEVFHIEISLKKVRWIVSGSIFRVFSQRE